LWKTQPIQKEQTRSDTLRQCHKHSNKQLQRNLRRKSFVPIRGATPSETSACVVFYRSFSWRSPPCGRSNSRTLSILAWLLTAQDCLLEASTTAIGSYSAGGVQETVTRSGAIGVRAVPTRMWELVLHPTRQRVSTSPSAPLIAPPHPSPRHLPL